jgi:hypothetical protein
VVGKAKVMRYEDIVEAQKKRDAIEFDKEDRALKRQRRGTAEAKAKRTRRSELEIAEAEIEAQGLRKFCTIFQV